TLLNTDNFRVRASNNYVGLFPGKQTVVIYLIPPSVFERSGWTRRLFWSLNDLVGESDKVSRKLKTHRLRCFGVDDKLVSRRLLDRQICRFRSLEYSAGESGGTTEQFVAIRAIRHQAAVTND